MAFVAAFFGIHITTIAIMQWRKTNHIFGAYMASLLLWLLLFPLLNVWIEKLMAWYGT